MDSFVLVGYSVCFLILGRVWFVISIEKTNIKKFKKCFVERLKASK
jgi:hypothetical protein